MKNDHDEEFDLKIYSDDGAVAEADFADFLQDSKDDASVRVESDVAIIRTSDRITYRRCRRKHSWSNSLRGNLRPRQEASPLWLGSGFHFALEDFHGYHHFPSASQALFAYARATEKTGLELPEDAGELLELGAGMLDYYEAWLETREPLQTLWINNEPQVEVNFHIELPKEELIKVIVKSGRSPDFLNQYRQILYSITLDRVVIDAYQRLWTQEFKTAKQYQWFHLETDPQVSAYYWGTHLKYPGREIAGTIYQQFKKQLAAPPKFLGSTSLFSTSKRQKTTFALYRTALQGLYGPDKEIWPQPNRDFLEYLRLQETQDTDFLIKRDFVERSPPQLESEYRKILQEASEILDPNLPLYPNPTRDCSWDCPFNLACIHYDSGLDWQHELNQKMIKRDSPQALWRQFLEVPSR